MSEPIIQCQSVTKTFGKTEVLRGVDLALPKGSIVGLLGSNGAGKSTLIKCLLGLLRISSGSAKVMGDDPWELSADVKSRLGYVPQVISLYPWMKVKHVIQYTGAFYPNWNESWCQELMQTWDIDESKWIRTLSSGQLQRLALVMALGHQPDLLMLDEPAASLDPAGRRSLLTSLLEMNRDTGQTVLFSTHITSDLERVASHVAILSQGKMSFFGELDELKDRVKRIRIQSQRALPIKLEIPNAFASIVDGNTAVAAVGHYDADALEQFCQQWQASVDVEDLNLEDIFLEMQDA